MRGRPAEGHETICCCAASFRRMHAHGGDGIGELSDSGTLIGWK